MTVLERLRDLFPDASARALKQWLAGGRVRVEGVVVRDPRTPVAPDQPVELRRQPGPAFPAPLRPVHEDDDLLVIDKPAGLLTIATETERERTAYRLLWDYLARQTPPRRPFVVHRLDRDTSGLLVFAKSPRVKHHLQAQFEARSVERRYVALVAGRVGADRGRLSSWLAEPGRDRRRQAITEYEVLDRRRDTTLLALRLGTGRRHQIRMHLADLGHPIVGDREHGSRRTPARRLCLHATALGFVHPGTGEPVRFESRPPAEFGGPRLRDGSGW